MNTSKISSIEELEREKEKLRMTMTVTKDAFAKSIGTNRKAIKSYLVKRVAIPAGAAGLGIFALKKLTSSDKVKSPKSPKNNFSVLNAFVPLLINFAQTYFLKNKINTATEPEPSPLVDASREILEPTL